LKGRIYELMPLRWGSGAMIYTPSFIKTGSNVQQLTAENSQTNGVEIE
jgi:hypothetical protein